MRFFRRYLFPAVCAMLLTSPAISDQGLTVTDAWVPDAPPVARVRTAYMTISNPGKQPVSIDQMQSPDFAAVEIHRMEMENGMSRMLQMEKLTIPAGSEVKLESGGIHLMLLRPTHPLKLGDSVSLQALSKKKPVFSIEVKVTAAAEETHHHHH